MAEVKRHSKGRWRRGQLYAIVGTYRAKGATPEEVADKLHVSAPLVHQIYDWISEKEAAKAARSSTTHR